MMDQKLPVTLPINATEDRVMGGWEISQLMESQAKWQDGLLKEANDKLLYIDEVNLLDDHIVNIILDVTSTGVLVVQREGKRMEEAVSFTLVSTMNPEEGGLRPQLLDRFGLMVDIKAQTDRQERMKILQTVMEWDQAMFDFSQGTSSEYIDKAREKDQAYKQKLEDAKNNVRQIEIPKGTIEYCVELTAAFQAEGNRADYVIALASRAYAALHGFQQVNIEHIQAVAQLVLQHRRPEFLQSTQPPWTDEDENKVKDILT